MTQSGTQSLIGSTNPGNPNNGDTLTVNTSDGDSGTLSSTAAASASQQCDDLAGLMQVSALPCASVSVQQAGAQPTMSATLNLASPGSPLGSADLATVSAPSSPRKLFTARYTSPTGSYCPTTSGDGCVHAGSQRFIGTTTLAGLPSGILGTAPAGWAAPPVPTSLSRSRLYRLGHLRKRGGRGNPERHLQL